MSNIHDRDYFLNTPLHIASNNSHLSIVELVISKGAKVNDKNKNGDSPILLASREGHLSIVELLISKGANVNDSNDYHETVLSVASRVNMIIFLLLHGAIVELESHLEEESYLLNRFRLTWPLAMFIYCCDRSKVGLLPELVEMLEETLNYGKR